MSDLRETISDARKELRDWLVENPRARDADDFMHEIADQAVPVYTSDILEYAMDDLYLATEQPEIGVSPDATPISMISLNIYDKIYNELCQELREFQEELADAVDCAQCGEPVFESDESVTCEDCDKPMHLKCVVEQRTTCDDCQEEREEEKAEMNAKELDDAGDKA
jgi:hypothetical protein